MTTIALVFPNQLFADNPVVRESQQKVLLVQPRTISEEMTDNADKTASQANETSITVVKPINSIAEQKNLLALNAAIEAPERETPGKGVAVVAQP